MRQQIKSKKNKKKMKKNNKLQQQKIGIGMKLA